MLYVVQADIDDVAEGEAADGTDPLRQACCAEVAQNLVRAWEEYGVSCGVTAHYACAPAFFRFLLLARIA